MTILKPNHFYKMAQIRARLNEVQRAKAIGQLQFKLKNRLRQHYFSLISWFHIDLKLLLKKNGFSLAVAMILRSSRSVVTLGRPGRGKSFTIPVARNFFARALIACLTYSHCPCNLTLVFPACSWPIAKAFWISLSLARPFWKMIWFQYRHQYFCFKHD